MVLSFRRSHSCVKSPNRQLSATIRPPDLAVTQSPVVRFLIQVFSAADALGAETAR